MEVNSKKKNIYQEWVKLIKFRRLDKFIFQILIILAKGELIGCFVITEPNYGSDAAGKFDTITYIVQTSTPISFNFLKGIETEAKYDEKTNTYTLNGLKTWIYNAPIADICLVWARCEDKKIRCLIIDKAEGSSGLVISKIPGKFSLRASEVGMISMKDVCVPEQNLLPNVQGIKGAMSCITNARYAVAWGVWGN